MTVSHRQPKTLFYLIPPKARGFVGASSARQCVALETPRGKGEGSFLEGETLTGREPARAGRRDKRRGHSAKPVFLLGNGGNQTQITNSLEALVKQRYALFLFSRFFISRGGGLVMYLFV